jgi:hypothetical protein
VIGAHPIPPQQNLGPPKDPTFAPLSGYALRH